jgi:N-acyl-D-amino-acid deacylase
MRSRLMMTGLVIALLSCSATAEEQYDLLIRDGQIIDGSGNPWFYGDIGIREGRIARIGMLEGAQAERTIDAAGLVVAPGFIDVHTHADADLHRFPLAENFIRNGVTTIVTGNCGGSVTDVGRFFERLGNDGVSLNVATLIGHNSVLRRVKGSRAGDLTAEQMEEAKQMVRQAMLDGAVGMSTGLIYTPGTYSSTEEIIELQRVAGELGGIYATHMRSETTAILEAIDEALRIGRESGSRVQISHFKLPMDMAERLGGADATLGKVVEARKAGQEVWIDQYPYTASSTTIAVLLPRWVREDGDEVGREMLKEPEHLERALRDMRQAHEVNRPREDMSYAVIASSRAYPELSGKNLKQAAQILKVREKGGEFELMGDDPPALPEVTMEEQYRTIIDIYQKGGASMVYHTMDEREVADIMRHPLVAICSDSGIRQFGVGQPHPRGYGTNARVLGRYVREMRVITLEDAIRKMTSLPALAFRFEDRGLLREGFAADITIFDPETVIDKATFEEPHQYPEGIVHVIVNGELVIEDGEVTEALPGAAVLGPGYDENAPRLEIDAEEDADRA